MKHIEKFVQCVNAVYHDMQKLQSVNENHVNGEEIQDISPNGTFYFKKEVDPLKEILREALTNYFIEEDSRH